MLVRNPNKLPESIVKDKVKFQISVGDLNDKGFIRKNLAGVTEVLHIGSIFYSLNLVEEIVRFKENIKRIILVHTTGIYSQFKMAASNYLQIEDGIRQLKMKYQLNIIILRPTMIFGDLKDLNVSKFIKMVNRFKIFPVVNHGSGLIQPVNARDLGKAYYQILNTSTKLQEEYILSGEHPLTMMDLFKIIQFFLKRQNIYISVPSKIAILGTRIVKIVTLNRVDFVEKVLRMDEDRSFSHESATRDFGYKPMSFKKGIQIEVQEYLKYKGDNYND